MRESSWRRGRVVAFALSPPAAFIYTGAYLVLLLGHLLGLVPGGVLSIFGLPILVAWVMGVVRWVLTGSPTPRRWLRS